MKVYAVSGSPRKGWSTTEVLEHALEGVRSVEAQAQVELVNVYDYAYTGCVSCYGCKRADGRFYGRCAKQDGITTLLEELSQADGIIFGSPVYFHDLTAQLRCLLERLLYPYMVYEKDGYGSLAPKRMPTAFIYTMNATEEKMHDMGYPERLSRMESFVEMIFTKPEVLYVNDTYQFSDYSKYVAPRFDEQQKRMRREQQFPIDCQNAFELGVRLARKIQ